MIMPYKVFVQPKEEHSPTFLPVIKAHQNNFTQFIMNAAAETEEPVEKTEAETKVPGEWDGKSYNWEYGDFIEGVLRGRTKIPSFRSEIIDKIVLNLVQERFGCIYHKLPIEHQKNLEVLLMATVQSSGHELGRAPAEVRENLPPEFFIHAIQRGARGWILKWAPEAVQNNHDVVMACVRDNGQALKYASASMAWEEDIQCAAVRENKQSIEYAVQPCEEALKIAANGKKEDDQQFEQMLQ